jgi:hypothetical protein
MYDIVFVSNNPDSPEWKFLKDRYPLAKRTDSVNNAQRIALTEFFWLVPDDVIVSDFDFDYTPDAWSKDVVHIFKNNTTYDGIALIPKQASITSKEIEHRFYMHKKEIDMQASVPKPYDLFLVDSYDDYIVALENSTTEMFWMSSANISVTIPNIYFSHHNKYDRTTNHAFIHRVDGNDHYNGLFLCSKHRELTEKEVDYRFIVNAKQWDVVASGPAEYPVFEIDSYDEYLDALKNSTTEMFWMSSANITATPPNIYFTHDNRYDRTQNHAFIHRVDHTDYYNGLFLCSKHRPLTQKEVEHRFLVNAKQWDVVASGPAEYPIFEIDCYKEYVAALEQSKTEMFWMSSANISVTIPNIYFTHNNEYDRKQNHAFIHRVDNTDLYNGVFLCSKRRPLTQKEVEHRFLVNTKSWDVVASGPCKYEIFHPTTYEDYLAALENSKTEMFWIIPDYVVPASRFKFDTYFSHDQQYNRTINHAYLNGKFHDGIVLCSKQAKFSRREFDYKFIAAKKEVDIVISTPAAYDIVFISYQEPNADENFARLQKQFPRAKRVHGVKGIHQAHINAAKLCDTDMVWIVDGDATIVDDFEFDYQVARWDKEVVHVWRSQNPINDMVYGYGGVKLFPTELTINMDTSKPDMTTSISSKFRAVHDISNITGFNTDPFNTWKSAFRECTKLASKVIDRQQDDETQERLQIWCTAGIDRPFGDYALSGANAGAAYGAKNQDNLDALRMINDFDWLMEKFNDL